MCASCGNGAEDAHENVVTPNDPRYPEQWALPAVSMPSAWSTSTGSSAVSVAVIDSGVQPVPDLAPNLGVGVRCEPSCGAAAGADPTGHGTGVASIIGSVGNNDLDLAGVAWSVTLLPVQVQPSQAASSVEGIAAGIRWANANGARVANISLVARANESAIAEAIAQAPNMLIVVPAGNDSRDVDSQKLPVFPCADPAPNVVCVAATDRTGGLTAGSNSGAVSVDLAAPGTDLLAAGRDGRPVFKSGTSFAAPMVTGAAALLLGTRPDATVAQIKAALLCGADRGQGTAGKVVSGTLNVSQAVRRLADGQGSDGCGP